MYNAKPGRESVDIEIFGMEGIPEEDLQAKVWGRWFLEPFFSLSDDLYPPLPPLGFFLYFCPPVSLGSVPSISRL